MLKQCQKIQYETIDAKQLISNQLSVAYKLFLYKILIKAATKAHSNNGLVAQGVSDIKKNGHVAAGRQSRSHDYQKYQESKFNTIVFFCVNIPQTDCQHPISYAGIP